MILYFSQILLISALLSVSYFVFFQKAKQFRLRRFLILLIPVLSLIIPFADKLSFLNTEMVNNQILSQMLDMVNVGDVNTSADVFSLNYTGLLLSLYLFIAVLLFVKLALQIRGIFQLKNQSKSVNGIYFTQKTHHPFSFFNSIFIPESQAQDLDIILEHERVHVCQKHSLDIIFYELLKVVFWFNPFNFLLKNELSNVHEFLADEKLLSEHTDIEKYCQILLQNSSLKYMAIGNNFNNSITKIRLIMMTKNNNKKWVPFKIFGMLAVMLTMTLAFNNCNQEQVEAPMAVEEVTEAPEAPEAPADIDLATDDSKVIQFKEVDVKPEFPGGMEALMQFLGNETKYPTVAKENGTQGKVYVSFVVDKQGLIGEVAIKRGVSSELDAEAVRVISSMPNWNPGEMDGKKVKVSYVIPLNFKLD